VNGWFDMVLLAKLGGAVVCGGIIGLEREFSHKPAGLRTNILICTGAMLFTVASLGIAASTGDPGRIAAQVVTGVGFLGAGTIIQSRGSVIGLTSAATIWVVAAIGVLIGLGKYAAAAQVSLCVLIVLWVLRWPEERLTREPQLGRLRLNMENSSQVLHEVSQVLRKYGLPMERVEVSRGGENRALVSVRFPASHRHRGKIMAALEQTEGVHSGEETIL
jgi:putative Mg2+ transporter-C (MgtC) family protein